MSGLVPCCCSLRRGLGPHQTYPLHAKPQHRPLKELCREPIPCRSWEHAVQFCW